MDQIARTARQVGQAIRRRRKALQLTQQALGRKTGRRQPTISALESGEPGTQLQTLFDALAALDLELVVRPRTRASADDIEAIF